MIDVMDVLSWDDIMFVDCETRSLAEPGSVEADVTRTSTRRYAEHAYPIIITWAHGVDGEVKRWEAKDITRPPTATELPKALRVWDGYFAAWNSHFDRHILDRYFQAGIDGWLDMMAHAAYNTLPLGLDRAAKSGGYEGKIAEGKKLIKLFCTPDGGTPQSHPEEWKRFCEYADVDVVMMQNVAKSSLPVPFAVWQEFWASEEINDRGLPVDVDMARGGAVIAKLFGEQTNESVSEITNGDMYSVRQYVKQRAWVWERIRGNPRLAEHMIIAQRETENGETEYKLKMDRPIITKLIAALETLDKSAGLTDDEYQVLLFLEEREYGASASPAKFGKVVDMAMPDGTLPGQYVFSGAVATGRFSSRGVQTHNMTRKTIGDTMYEADACSFLIELGEEATRA